MAVQSLEVRPACICESSLCAQRLLKASFLSEAFDGLCPTALGDQSRPRTTPVLAPFNDNEPTKGALQNGSRGRGHIAKFEVLLPRLPSTSCSSTPHEPSITQNVNLSAARTARIREGDPTLAQPSSFHSLTSCCARAAISRSRTFLCSSFSPQGRATAAHK